MTLPDPVIVRGVSGSEYQLWPYPLGSEFLTTKGIYALCHPYGEGYWWVHYVGQAKDLNNRAGSGVRNHEKLPTAQALGATHVLAATFDCDEATLCWIENDIIQALNPPLNKNAPPGFGLRGLG